MTPANAVEPFPAGTVLRADPGLRLRDRGRLLIGGTPFRVLRLSDPGAVMVERWLSGQPVRPGNGPTSLARRLVEAGMVHPELPELDEEPDLTVVIPVRDDKGGLDRTLSGLSSFAVVVVDDGSIEPVEINRPLAAGPASLRVRRRSVSGGPGQARQEAIDQGDFATSLVAFVDAGVELDDAHLRSLARWFADPTVVAVAPRVMTSAGADSLTGYEADHSPIDMGPTPSPVAPGLVVSYVPAACLLVRLAGLEAVGGFDPGLRYGEDVDLVWRLGDQAGTVRYDPSVVIHHPARRSLGSFARQRFGYGSSAGPLAARHGDRLAPVRLSRWSLAIWCLVATGHTPSGLGLAALSARLLRDELAPTLPDPGVEATRLASEGHWRAGKSLGDAALRVWWPVTLGAALAGFRRPVLLLAASAWGRRLLAGAGSPAQRGRELAFAIVDDSAYGAGVWAGAWRTRSLRCLLPRLAEWPGNRRSDGPR